MAGLQNGDLEATTYLLNAMNAGRVDILCSLLHELKTKENFQEILVKHVNEHGHLLHNAVYLDSPDMASALLQFGSNPATQNPEKKSSYELANSDVMQKVFVREALFAISKGDATTLQRLLTAGVPPDSFEESGQTLLTWACMYSEVNLVNILVQLDANVNLPNKKGESPLVVAVKKGNEPIVRRLLQENASPFATDPATGNDCFAIARQKEFKEVLDVLNDSLIPKKISRLSSNRLTRSPSLTSDVLDDVISIAPSINGSTSTLIDKIKPVEPVSHNWTDLLWPQPSFLHEVSGEPGFKIPVDSTIKVYLDDSSELTLACMRSAVGILTPQVTDLGLHIDFRGHKSTDTDIHPWKSNLTVGVYADGRATGSYTLFMNSKGTEIYAVDYNGILNGFSTFVQILRIHMYYQKIYFENDANLRSGTRPFVPKKILLPNHNAKIEGILTEGHIPVLTIRDEPVKPFRGVFQDFSGCRVLNKESVLALITRIAKVKATHLFINFEVRTTDRYQLPYTNKDLFDMVDLADKYGMTLVPSLDTQTNNLEPNEAGTIVNQFIHDFPMCKVAHFGSNLSGILLTSKDMLNQLQRRIPRLYMSMRNDEEFKYINQTPPFVTLCIDWRSSDEAMQKISPHLPLIVKFPTCDDGYICTDAESSARVAYGSAKLCGNANVIGGMICDMSTGCEAMPPSLTYMNILTSVGVFWNKEIDIKQFIINMPVIAAINLLNDGDLVALFEQVWILGNVEKRITEVANGIKDTGSENSGLFRTKPISTIVEIILNPDMLSLDKLTATDFQKAKVESSRALKTLDILSKSLPYNFQVALIHAEIKLVADIMYLTANLGLAIFTARNKLEGEAKATTRLGVAQLPDTARTDLANRLLYIRRDFPSVWLASSNASTLPNALKLFDTLFKCLLPDNLQDFGSKLL